MPTEYAMSGATDTGHLGERLHALIDRELGPEDEAKARAHLAACETCRVTHAKLAGAVTAVAALGRSRASEGFAARVLKRVRAERRGFGLRATIDQKVPYEGSIIVLLAAAMAAALLAYGLTSDGGLLARNEAAKLNTPTLEAPK